MADMDKNAIAQSLKDLERKSVPERNRAAIGQSIAALEHGDLNTSQQTVDGGAAGQAVAPIPMLLFCPACGLQHIDAPEPACDGEKAWDNPPHRSHKCHACATVWRPADVPTVGVASIQTTGKADTWDLSAHTVAAGAVRTVTIDEVEKSLLRKLLSFAWEVDIMWHRDRNEIRRIKLDVRDGVSMAPRLVEHRVDLIREFVVTARNAFSPGGGADDELRTPDQTAEAAQ